jgi:hypothetical protein
VWAGPCGGLRLSIPRGIAPDDLPEYEGLPCSHVNLTLVASGHALTSDRELLCGDPRRRCDGLRERLGR